jgi:hypothetical protein
MAVLKEICGDCVEITRVKQKNGVEFARQSQELRKIRSNRAFLTLTADGKGEKFDMVLLYSFISDRFIRLLATKDAPFFCTSSVIVILSVCVQCAV